MKIISTAFFFIKWRNRQNFRTDIQRSRPGIHFNTYHQKNKEIIHLKFKKIQAYFERKVEFRFHQLNSFSD